MKSLEPIVRTWCWAQLGWRTLDVTFVVCGIRVDLLLQISLKSMYSLLLEWVSIFSCYFCIETEKEKGKNELESILKINPLKGGGIKEGLLFLHKCNSWKCSWETICDWGSECWRLQLCKSDFERTKTPRHTSNKPFSYWSICQFVILYKHNFSGFLGQPNSNSNQLHVNKAIKNNRTDEQVIPNWMNKFAFDQTFKSFHINSLVTTNFYFDLYTRSPKE